MPCYGMPHRAVLLSVHKDLLCLKGLIYRLLNSIYIVVNAIESEYLCVAKNI